MPNFEQAGNYEYDPKDYLDHGAFAVVYRGRHRINKKHIVAIKVISKKKLVKSQSLLEKEIKILKELTAVHHENIVALLEFNDVNGNVNLIMEYCNGGNLSDYLNRCGTLSEDTIRIFLSQLANAMQAMNAKGVVHRDLKPQNILLSHKDNVNIKQIPPSEIKLKVADFGFARILQDGVMAATLCGSPMYMAPEVIMSLQYDAKADLWSLGTIVFQCLTGIAPFQAQTPQALKAFYETNANLSPKLPAGTSSELRELLTGLLRRNAAERIDFTTFFNHPFLHRCEAPKPTSPLTDLPPSLGNLHIGSPLKGMENQGHIPHSPPTPIPTNMSPMRSDTPNSATGTASSSPEMTDDFVLVPANLPVDHSSSSAQNTEKPFSKAATPLLMRQMSAPTTCGPSTNSNSPTPAAVRPGSLPMTEPIPVPRMRAAYMRMRSRENPNEALPPQSAPADTNRMHGVHENSSSPVPRSQPISMKRAERSSQPDISSLSPPSVQFTLGTPPNSYGSRRRSSSGSFSETPPPPSLWQVSPGAAGKLTPTSSPLRRSGTSSPILSGQVTTVMHMGSPTSNAALLATENNNVRHANIFPFGTRAMTLPDISEAGSFHNMYEMEADFEHDPLNFEPPELPEETLLEREHNETLAKLNFVLTLSDCVLKIAAQRGSPLSLGTGNDCVAVDNKTSGTEIVGLDAHTIKRFEQMVLLVRALQLLGSGLHLANEQLKSGQLRPSTTVRKVVSTLNKKFRSTLTDCRKINGNNLLQRAEQAKITADKILYNHAIQMCQHAALDELFGSPEDCFKQYQTAQILLHSLAHQISHQHDRNILSKYKEAVEKRLYLLQQRGYVIATDQT